VVTVRQLDKAGLSSAAKWTAKRRLSVFSPVQIHRDWSLPSTSTEGSISFLCFRDLDLSFTHKNKNGGGGGVGWRSHTAKFDSITPHTAQTPYWLFSYCSASLRNNWRLVSASSLCLYERPASRMRREREIVDRDWKAHCDDSTAETCVWVSSPLCKTPQAAKLVPSNENYTILWPFLRIERVHRQL
jgi:hypothetical protein